MRKLWLPSCVLGWVALFGLSLVQAAEGPVMLPNAHSHNDYQHRRPCLDALDHGFGSIEADIYLVDDQLLVGHDESDLTPKRTLQALYLDPLRERARQNGGRIYPGGGPIWLLIDLKQPGEAIHETLEKLLAEYDDIISSVVKGQVTERAVRVVLSGDRSWEWLAAASTRHSGGDGRLADLDSPRPAHLMPWISDKWSNRFQWKGKGPLSAEERALLRQYVAQAHAAGRCLRFWAVPDNPTAWKELSAAGVDLINTDKLDELQAFLLKQ